MIYFLIQTNILTISHDDYLRLVNLYKMIDRGNIDAVFDFKKIILAYPSKPDSKIKIRFLGDMLADRGANDYLTLIVLSLLKDTTYEILLSNHDLEYLTHSERNTLKDIDATGFMSNSCIQSLYHLKQFLNSQTDITPDHIHTLEDLYYKPYLKFFSYTITNNNIVNLFSHAVINLKTIEESAKRFKIDSKNIKNSRDRLCEIIDNINHEFQKVIVNKNVHKLFDLKNSGAGTLTSIISSHYPLEQVVWNRGFINSNQIMNNKAAYISHFHHGHTSDTGISNYHCYDNRIGKGPMNNIGTKKMHCSSDFPIDHSKYTPQQNINTNSSEIISKKINLSEDKSPPVYLSKSIVIGLGSALAIMALFAARKAINSSSSTNYFLSTAKKV